MHAILSLIEDDGLRPIQHRICDFSVASRRQAMHEYRVRSSLLHERLIYLKWSENRRPLGGLVFVPHADAYVGIDRVRALNRRLRVLHKTQFADVLLSDLTGLGHDLDIRRIAAR